MTCSKDDSGICCGVCGYNPIVVMATHDRIQITETNLKSLQGTKVVLMVSTQQELEHFKKFNITVALAPNKPLGSKWHTGVKIAQKMGANPLIIVGSDDILSKNYIKTVVNEINSGFNIVGLTSWYSYSPIKDELYHCEYVGRNVNFPIGSGRAFSSKFLDRIKWNVFNQTANRLLDDHVIKMAGNEKIKLIRTPEVLAVKGNWEVLNKFDAYLKSPNIKATKVDKSVLDKFNYF